MSRYFLSDPVSNYVFSAFLCCLSNTLCIWGPATMRKEAQEKGLENICLTKGISCASIRVRPSPVPQGQGHDVGAPQLGTHCQGKNGPKSGARNVGACIAIHRPLKGGWDSFESWKGPNLGRGQSLSSSPLKSSAGTELFATP